MTYYSSPYSTSKAIGEAYNQFMRLLPNDTDFACLTDGDTLWTTNEYGHHIEGIVADNPQGRLFYATTNRIASPWQRMEVPGDDIRVHREFGRKCAETYGRQVREVPGDAIPGSGFLILLRKDLWNELKGFNDQGILEVDWDFFRRAAAHGEKIYQMKGVYLYHWYRGGNPQDLRHLTSARRPRAEILKAAMTCATQVPEELDGLLQELEQRKPVHFMEIGTDRGGTFYAFANLAAQEGLKISLDLPRVGFWKGFDFAKLHREMPQWFKGVHLVHADSHDEATLRRVRSLLGDRRLDFLFIDGDHSYEGVKADFQMYSPLVRPGGLVAFHDIVDSPRHREQGCHVHDFWQELKGRKRELIFDESWGGIGLIELSR